MEGQHWALGGVVQGGRELVERHQARPWLLGDSELFQADLVPPALLPVVPSPREQIKMASGGYTDLHRLFLQSMMSRAIVKVDGAKQLLLSIARLVGFQMAGVRDHEVTTILKEINKKISSFGMELKEILSEHDATKFVVLTNTTDSSAVIDKISHAYNEKERELFRLLLEGIVENESYGSISSMEALNLQINGMRAGDIQDALDKFVSDQWFLETDSGRLIPAARCIAEFDSYFKRCFPGRVHVCNLCSNVVFYGVECPSCSAVTHKHCFTTFNAKKSAPVCPLPSCREPVLGHSPQNGEERSRQKKKAGPGASKRGPSASTPQDTPTPSQEESPSSSQTDSTPITRGRRKRPSAD